MTRHRIARVALGAVAGMLAVFAGLIIDPRAHVVEAPLPPPPRPPAMRRC